MAEQIPYTITTDANRYFIVPKGMPKPKTLEDAQKYIDTFCSIKDDPFRRITVGSDWVIPKIRMEVTKFDDRKIYVGYTIYVYSRHYTTNCISEMLADRKHQEKIFSEICRLIIGNWASDGYIVRLKSFKHGWH